MFFQMDSIGYNARRSRPRTTCCRGASCSIPKWRGKVALFGIDWLGMLDAALGMQALGLLNPATSAT